MRGRRTGEQVNQLGRELVDDGYVLGVRQARYFGKSKVRFQIALAAAVANLTLLISPPSNDLGLALLALAIIALVALLIRSDAKIAPPSRIWSLPPKLAFESPKTSPSRPDS